MVFKLAKAFIRHPIDTAAGLGLYAAQSVAYYARNPRIIADAMSDRARAMADFGRAAAQNPLGVLTGVAIVSKWGMEGAARSLSEELRYATHDVTFFSPPASPGPHWQDLVFGDGRAEKLLEKLKDIPQIKPRQQKEAMELSSGVEALPENLELVKYGLNDNFLQTMITDMRHNLRNEGAENISESFPESVTLDPEHGPLDEDPNEFGDRICTQSVVHWRLTEAYRTLFEDLSYDNPLQSRTDIVHDIEKAVLQWAVQDVLPVVPMMVNGYRVTGNREGTVTLNRDDNNKVMRYLNDDLPLYRALSNGYKGTLPNHEKTATSAPGPIQR